MPLVISGVVKGGKGEIGGIAEGETILEINGNDTSNMPHFLAQKLIKNTGFSLNLILDKSFRIGYNVSQVQSGKNFPPQQTKSSPPMRKISCEGQRNTNQNRMVKILRTNSMESELWDYNNYKL